jgi:hypothetical protein
MYSHHLVQRSDLARQEILAEWIDIVSFGMLLIYKEEPQHDSKAA